MWQPKRIKNSDEDVVRAINSPKRVEEILKEQIEAGLHEHRRSKYRLFLSAVTAGMEVGFSVLLMGMLYTLLVDKISLSSMDLALAFSYPIGFIFVIIGRSELFTEHTNVSFLPVLAGKVGLRSLGQIWGVIYVGNLIGGYLISLILIAIGPSMGILSGEALYHLAEKLVHYDWYIILGSSILAGWLMGLLSWLITASRETLSRIFLIILVTTFIGLGGLHHSIVGSIEVFSGMVSSDNINISDYLMFQSLATIGNIIGGVVFVSLFKYGHSIAD